MARTVETVEIKFIANVQGFLKGMGTSMERMKEMRTKTGKLNTRFKEMRTTGGKLAMNLRKLTHGFRGFRMEMLGVMFFGMGMQKFFTGLLKPALELTGAMDVWRIMLQTLFLPIAMELLEEWIMPFVEWMINLSDATKLLIGKWVLIGAAAGTFLFFIGMLALGVGSLILAFSGVFNVLESLVGGWAAAGIMITGMSTAIAFLKDLFGSLMEEFMKLDFVKETFRRLGIEVKNKTPWEVLKATAIAVIDKIKEKLGFAGDTGTESLGGSISSIGESLKNISLHMEAWTPTIQRLGDALAWVADNAERIASVAGGALIGTVAGGTIGALGGPGGAVGGAIIGGVTGGATGLVIDIIISDERVRVEGGGVGNLVDALNKMTPTSA